jgi:hypothetical protein
MRYWRVLCRQKLCLLPRDMPPKAPNKDDPLDALLQKISTLFPPTFYAVRQLRDLSAFQRRRGNEMDAWNVRSVYQIRYGEQYLLRCMASTGSLPTQHLFLSRSPMSVSSSPATHMTSALPHPLLGSQRARHSIPRPAASI